MATKMAAETNKGAFSHMRAIMLIKASSYTFYGSRNSLRIPISQLWKLKMATKMAANTNKGAMSLDMRECCLTCLIVGFKGQGIH